MKENYKKGVGRLSRATGGQEGINATPTKSAYMRMLGKIGLSNENVKRKNHGKGEI